MCLEEQTSGYVWNVTHTRRRIPENILEGSVCVCETKTVKP